MVETRDAHDAIWQEGHVAWKDGDLARAFLLFSQAAGEGHLSSITALALFYDSGLHVAKDESKALLLYRRAARKSDIVAMNNIATLHRDAGKTRLATRWFQRCIAKGDGEAAFEIARMRMKTAPRRNAASIIHYLKLAQSLDLTPYTRDLIARVLHKCSRIRK